MRTRIMCEFTAMAIRSPKAVPSVRFMVIVGTEPAQPYTTNTVCTCPKSLLDEWEAETRTGAHDNDQPALNAVVKKNFAEAFNAYTLPNSETIPTGIQYFQGGRRSGADPEADERRTHVVIVHKNWFKGREDKLKRFRRHNLWYSSSTAENIGSRRFANAIVLCKCSEGAIARVNSITEKDCSQF